ncbi:hypothetical protein TgHK011_008213 [Trichoderma gracile]|nr:hypothetical protein TgHK011_008213 [Trichoderma gracile]
MFVSIMASATLVCSSTISSGRTISHASTVAATRQQQPPPLNYLPHDALNAVNAPSRAASYPDLDETPASRSPAPAGCTWTTSLDISCFSAFKPENPSVLSNRVLAALARLGYTP